MKPFTTCIKRDNRTVTLTIWGDSEEKLKEQMAKRGFEVLKATPHKKGD